MSEMREATAGNLEPAQAAELALLVELEARWENLRKLPPRAQEGGSATQDLLVIQKAYDAFRGKLVAYNKRYRPAHVPELLLNTPPRLAAWCRSMRTLCLSVEHDPRAQPPVQLLEKAYRLVERVGARLDGGRSPRSTSPATVGAAARDLETLGRWCEELAAGAGPSRPEVASSQGSRHANCE